MSTYTTPLEWECAIGATPVELGYSDFAQHFERVDRKAQEWGLFKSCQGDTQSTTALVHKINKHFVYRELFESFGTTLRDLTLTPTQIVEFFKVEKENLPRIPATTYFLILKDERFYVGRVYLRDIKRADFYVYRLDDEDLWTADKSLVVVPKNFAK